MIKVDNKEVEFIVGMTVADVLTSVGERVDQMVIVVIEGKVISREELDITYIVDNSKVTLLRLISGG